MKETDKQAVTDSRIVAGVDKVQQMQTDLDLCVELLQRFANDFDGARVGNDSLALLKYIGKI